jgi:hypothetical protein
LCVVCEVSNVVEEEVEEEELVEEEEEETGRRINLVDLVVV